MTEKKTSTPYSDVIRGLAAVQGLFSQWGINRRNEKACAVARLLEHIVLHSPTLDSLRACAAFLQSAVETTEHDGHDGTNHRPTEYPEYEYPAVDALVTFRKDLAQWIQAGAPDPRGPAVVRLLEVIPLVALSSRVAARADLDRAIEIVSKRYP
jgi:hypothetical protein